jgi:hypothetical protein
VTTESPSLSTTRLEGLESPERDIARDLVKRGLPMVPVLMLVMALPWGVDGALSAAFAAGVVLVNFLFAAAVLTWAGRISLAFLMGAALFGYLIRLAVVFAAVMLVKDASWVELWPLGLALIITHLGLLFWETRYVSASLAFPGLRPTIEKD